MKSPTETSKVAICLALVMLLGIACQAHNTYSMKGKYRWRAGKRSYYSQTNHLRAQPSFSNLFPEISKLQSEEVQSSPESLRNIVVDLRDYCNLLLQLLDDLDGSLSNEASE